MKAPSRALGDTLLAGFAVVVLVACVLVVKQSGAQVGASTLTESQNTPVRPRTTASATVQPSATPTDAPGPVVVAGPDLAKLGSDLVAASGDTVLVAESAGQQALASGALDGIEQTPSVVIVQVVAGTKTSARTTEAITAVRARWPHVRLLLVGPFSAADTKSSAAVKSAAAAAHVTFLDPVELKWRTNDASSTVSEADYSTIAAKLTAAIS